MKDNEGIQIAQHPDFAEKFKMIIAGFDRIIEIGTWAGGLTVWLHKNKPKDCDLISYDIDESLNEVPKGKYPIDFRIGDCFSGFYHEEIKSLIQDSKRVLLLCDGGHKNEEVKTFCQYLKEDDVIMCHDYADNWEDWLSHRDAVDWPGAIESSLDALAPTLVRNDLSKYSYYDEFKSIFWGSFTRK